MTSRRKCIDAHCKSCIYDDLAAGTWRQQVSLCSVISCALYRARPKTKYSIPDSVLSYYGVKSTDFQGAGRDNSFGGQGVEP
jgi:hypothetical protein